MIQVKWIHIVLWSLYFTSFVGNTVSVEYTNKIEYGTEKHRRRHNSTADTSSGNNDISHKERFPSNLEYRLMRMEVQFIEKFDSVNSEIRENNNRLQNLEWQYAETQRSIDGALPLLESYLKQQPHHQQQSSVASGTIDDRLNKLAEATANLIATSRVFYRDLAEVKGNLSNVAVMTKAIYDGSHQFVTYPTLKRALNSLESSPSNLPITQHVQQQQANRTYHSNCLEIINNDANSHSGIYQIRTKPSADPTAVYCDMKINGGGWTVIQRRYDGSQSFYSPWSEYKRGFGNIGGEFWLGLDHIHDLTGTDVNELLVELEDQDGVRVQARYGAFSIGDELEGYRLRVLAGYQQDGYSDVYEERFAGSRSNNAKSKSTRDLDTIAAGDSLSYHAGSRFSTFDMDDDSWLEGSCAQSHGGGWWYNNCDRSNLNGRYLQPIDLHGDPLLPEEYTYKGMYWETFHGPRYSLRKTTMLIRPVKSYQMASDDGEKSVVDGDLKKSITDVFNMTD